MNLESSTAERVKSGVILALFAATVLLVGGALLIAFCILLTGVLSFEFLRVALPPYRRGVEGDLLSDDALIYSVALSLIPAGLVLGGLSGAASIAVLLVMATLLREMRRYEDGVHEEHSLDSVSALALTLIYPVLLATIFLGAVLQIPAEPHRVLIWYVVIVAFNDIGAWAVGTTIGKRKLAPRTSPGKSCEGALGGCALALLLSVPLAFLLKVPLDAGVMFVFALLISCLSQLGDLVESFFKRLLGVKDMGETIPGHGGVLDRLDGHLFASPALFLMTQLL